MLGRRKGLCPGAWSNPHLLATCVVLLTPQPPHGPSEMS